MAYFLTFIMNYTEIGGSQEESIARQRWILSLHENPRIVLVITRGIYICH
jgi:hypothetical protein